MSLAETAATARDTGILAAAIAIMAGVVKALLWLNAYLERTRAAAEAKAMAREERAALEARRDAETIAHRERVEGTLERHGEHLGRLAKEVAEVSKDVSRVCGRLDEHDRHRAGDLRAVK